MYDIYSNVEDPDGFYGIQNDDIMDSLLRRLDHEGQPAKSLGYNLANYEATATGSIGASPALVPSVRSLHDLGYHSFAGNFIKATRRQGATDSNSDPFFLELAWRMGDWDVPITKELADTTPGRFYTALRAVHRERDRDVARRIVDDTIHHEMTRLQQIGMERMTEIKAATISLLCLRDVAKWVSPSVQTAIDQCEFDGPLLRQFVDMDASFE
jgi:ataxia telangiectasia mutated family protein